MDASSALLIIACVASMWLAGYMAYERGRSRRRWILIAALIGPLAIPLIYLADAASAVRKMVARPGL
jgi:hypothetical protein